MKMRTDAPASFCKISAATTGIAAHTGVTLQKSCIISGLSVHCMTAAGNGSVEDYY